MNESAPSPGKNASVLGFLSTIILVVAGFIFLFKAAYSHDLLWFWPVFDQVPAQVEIRCLGSSLLLDGASTEALAITRLFNDQMSGSKRFDPLTLSNESFQYYQEDPGVVTLELIYAAPVRVHLSTLYFTNITSLLIPLQGRYASAATVFGLIDGQPSGGSLHVETNREIILFLEENALCSMNTD